MLVIPGDPDMGLGLLELDLHQSGEKRTDISSILRSMSQCWPAWLSGSSTRDNSGSSKLYFLLSPPT